MPLLTSVWASAARSGCSSVSLPSTVCSGHGRRSFFITIAKWFPRRERGRIGAFWNISHNVGGGIVAPIVGAAFAVLGTEHWQAASYAVPAVIAVVFAVIVLLLGKGSPEQEGLPALAEMMPEEKWCYLMHKEQSPENMSAFQIFCTYVLKNKTHGMSLLLTCSCTWFVSGDHQLAADLPADRENFSKDQMSNSLPVLPNGLRFRPPCWQAG